MVREGKSPNYIISSKAADTSKIKFKVFVSVVIEKKLVYTLSQDGNVYVFDKDKKLKLRMNIKVERAFNINISEGVLFCGCAGGLMRVFDASTLVHKLTMSKPPPLGTTNLRAGIQKIEIK